MRESVHQPCGITCTPESLLDADRSYIRPSPCIVDNTRFARSSGECCVRSMTLDPSMVRDPSSSAYQHLIDARLSTYSCANLQPCQQYNKTKRRPLYDSSAARSRIRSASLPKTTRLLSPPHICPMLRLWTMRNRRRKKPTTKKSRFRT